MSRLRLALAFVAVASLAGCAANAADSSAGEPLVSARGTRSSVVTQPISRAPRPTEVLGVEIVAIGAAQAEDGRGAVVAAHDAIAIDITATRWPVRALDPVLHVGQIRLRHYRHVAPRVLRFVIADRASLPTGVPAFVQYGDDVASRVDVAPSLAVRP